jgi:hypothetical protein
MSVKIADVSFIPVMQYTGASATSLCTRRLGLQEANLGLDDITGAEATMDLDLVDLRQPHVLQPAAASRAILGSLHSARVP